MARNHQSQNSQNGQSDSWNQNTRHSQSDDRIMRRGDDRSYQGSDYGSQQGRNAYRTDDYPTDTNQYRAGEDRTDRDMAYGHYGSRNNQQQGQRNYTNDSAPYTFSPDRNSSSYGWSNDYRSSQDYRGGSQDYRGSQDRDNSWTSNQPSTSYRAQGSSWDSSMGSGRWNGQDNMYGQGGDLSSSRSYGSGMSNFGSSTSDSMRGGSFGSSGYGSQSNSNFAGNQSGVNSSNFGAGYYGSSSSYGSGLGTSSYSQSQSQSPSSRTQEGMHYGKGPKNYRRSDDRIKEDVSEALERNAHIDASEIEIDVKDSVVTLRGHVEDRQTKRLAEDLVSGIYSVKDVRNELTVDQSIFTQARNAIFGESVESQSASSTNANKSTATKSKH